MKAGIYRIRNTTNGHQYVGSTMDFGRRRGEHFKRLRSGTHPCRHLQAAFVKYGEAVFLFEIVAHHDGDLTEQEQRTIDDVVTSFGRGSLYNASLCADRPQHSEESRALIRASKIGAANPMFGKNHTSEAGAKMSAARKGRPTWNKGMKATPEHRAAISAGSMGKVASEESKQKRSAAMKGRPFSEEHLRNLRASQIRRRARERGEDTDL